jgi:hypothetical protein
MLVSSHFGRDDRNQPQFMSERYRLHNIVLGGLIRCRHAEQAVEYYIHHPSEVFSHTFMKVTESVDGFRIDRVYVNCKRILAQYISDGDIRSPLHLHRLAVSVLKTLGRHHEILTWHRDHPLLPIAANVNDNNDREPLPLFASGTEVADVAATTVNPADRAIRNELYATILRVARELRSLKFRAIQIHRRYVFENRKSHGGYVHLARFAVLDPRGRVVAFQPWRTAVDMRSRPSAPLIRQVRAIHRAAEKRLLIVARRHGIELPPVD